MALVELYRITGEAALPRARAVASSSGAATASWRAAGSVPRIGRTMRRSATRRRSPDMPSASCISTAAPSMSPSRSAMALSSMRSSGAGTTWWRLAPTSRAVWAAVTATRRSAIRTSCRRTRPMPRRAPRSRASCSPGGCCSRPVSRLRRRHRADGLQRGPPGHRPRRHVVLLRQPAPAPDRARRRRSAARANDGRGIPCACCPPNIMRTLSSWEQLVATTDGTGVQIQQYVDGTVSAQVGGGEVRLRMSTDQPWDGRVSIEVEASPAEPWTLSLRRPGWTDGVELTWPADSAGPGEEARGEAARTATWRAGDRVELDMPMTPRITRPHPRIDAVRGAVAIERGPLVYCLETADLPAEAVLEDIRLALEQAPTSEPRSDLRMESSESSRTGRSAVRGRRRRWRSGRSRISHGPTAGRMGCGYGSRPPTQRTPEPSRGRSAGAQSIAGRSATAR